LPVICIQRERSRLAHAHAAHIRHYGLLGNRHRAENLARCRELLGVVAPTIEPQPDYRERYRQLTGEDPLRCPQCRIGQMLRIAVLPAKAPGGWDSS
jgi:hypothetical protein